MSLWQQTEFDMCHGGNVQRKMALVVTYLVYGHAASLLYPPIGFALTGHQRHLRCVPCKEPSIFELILETHRRESGSGPRVPERNAVLRLPHRASTRNHQTPSRWQLLTVMLPNVA
jgi:hypothetical protein